MLRDHGFDKYEGALAALCPVERRRDGFPSEDVYPARVFLVVLIVGGKVADRGRMTILLILLLIGGI